MNEEEQYVDSSYKMAILQKWLRIMDLSERFREGLLVNNEDGSNTGFDIEIGKEYIAAMTRLWLELLPKVEGRPEFKGLQEDFMKYRQYSASPTKFFENDNRDTENQLFLLEETLGKIVDKLKITVF
jgi:hypothetical protein